MGLFNMSAGQGMGQPGQPMPAPFDPMQGQSPSLFNFSTPQAISNPAPAKPKHNWAGIASSFLAGVTGRPDSYMKSVEDQRKEAMDLAQTQREQAGKFAQFQQEYDYKAAHPGPDDFSRRLETLNGIDPGLGSTYAHKYAEQGGAAMLGNMTDPTTGQVYAAAAKVPHAAPTAEAITRLRGNPAEAQQYDEIFGPGASASVLGGQTPQASGNFPR